MTDRAPSSRSQLILHNVQRRLSCLLAMPRDLDEAWPRPSTPISVSAASPAHRALFQEYQKEAAQVAANAMEWWKGRLDVKQRREKVDRVAALKAMYQETVAGPGAAPPVVSLARKYWLECEKLNTGLPLAQRVPPEIFLLAWLSDGKHEKELDVLSGMIYWPVGLDDKGNWV